MTTDLKQTVAPLLLINRDCLCKINTLNSKRWVSWERVCHMYCELLLKEEPRRLVNIPLINKALNHQSSEMGVKTA